MDNSSICLLVQNVAGTERIGLSHSKVAWLMVQEILDNGSILFLFSTFKIQFLLHWTSNKRMYLYTSTYVYAPKVPKYWPCENYTHLSPSHRRPGLSSKFAWLMVQKILDNGSMGSLHYSSTCLLVQLFAGQTRNH